MVKKPIIGADVPIKTMKEWNILVPANTESRIVRPSNVTITEKSTISTSSRWLRMTPIFVSNHINGNFCKFC